jgi:carbon storage regulator
MLPRLHASRFGFAVFYEFSAYSIPPHVQFAILATTRRPVFSLWVRFPPFSALLHGGGNMLVLSRKLGEKIYIGDQICITVVDIDRGKIRLGIEAPRDVAIYRQELLPGKDTLITETVIETPVSSRRD